MKNKDIYKIMVDLFYDKSNRKHYKKNDTIELYQDEAYELINRKIIKKEIDYEKKENPKE